MSMHTERKLEKHEEWRGAIMLKREIVVGISIISLLLFFGGCANRNTEVSRINSPDGKYTAITFVRNGGATVDFSTQISIMKQNAALGHGVGNIFICDSDHGKASRLDSNSYWLRLSWLSPAQLVIEYDKNVRVFRMSEKYKSISIHYEPVVPPKGAN